MLSYTHKMQALPYRNSRRRSAAQDSDTLLPFSLLQAQQEGKAPATPSLQQAISLDPTYFGSELYTARQRSVSMKTTVPQQHTASTGTSSFIGEHTPILCAAEIEHRLHAWSAKEELAAPDGDVPADGVCIRKAACRVG